MRVSGYGIGIDVVAADTDLAEIVSHLPPGFALAFDTAGDRGADPSRTYELRRSVGVDVELLVDGATAAGPGGRAEVLHALRADLERFASEHSPTHVFVHAGVVAINGRAVVLPAASGAGKTTAVVALLKAGAIYLSDEFAVLDEHLMVHPYARMLNVRTGGSREPTVVDPGAFGAVAEAPVALGSIVLTRHESRGTWRPEAVPAGEALLELLQHTVPTRRDPDRVLGVLARACESVPVLSSPRGSAESFAAVLMQSLA